ncbi:TlpA family protein disulfide reductase [Euzebyella marina]|uniref:TlpA family protein disulfide reductase n=1 Tax=Euzebyella marina TaxID=1761453 RepID=A0A3G2L8Y5_9FLAO|nr:TlpA disulfide reductase family protein [Euzebyella marina]AYN68651.1 TlpA family protein disulfide reductase [Euzebyella marina]
MKRKTVLTLAVIAIALSFFVTPVGYWSKVWLMQIFASAPEIIKEPNQDKIAGYDWSLKDADWNYFNFEKSKGKPVFIHFWASWHLPSVSELADIQKLYEGFNEDVDFYVVTNEEREPVEEFMSENKFTFPITYRIVGEPAPLKIPEPSGTYIIDGQGRIAVKSVKNKDWYNDEIVSLLTKLTQ